MVRYYGIYARHRESDKKLCKAIPEFKQAFYLSLTKWRNSIAYSFGYDPLKCSCGNQMSLLELFHNWIYTKKVDKYDKIEDRQRRQKNDRKEKQ